MGHGGDGGGGSERWLISYADFITLLMVLFVVLYSMGQIDVKRYRALAESLREAFSGGPSRVVDPSISQGGVGSADSAPAPITLDGIPQRLPDSLDVATRMTDLLTAHDLASEVSIRNNIEGVLISLSSQLLFVGETAELQPEGYPALDSIAAMVIPLDNELRVIGHTADFAPGAGGFESSWELSLARALTIVEYLAQRGIGPDRLTAAGQGEFRPVFPNDTPDHRAFNGWAEIIIVYPVDEYEWIDLNIGGEDAPLPDVLDTPGGGS